MGSGRGISRPAMQNMTKAGAASREERPVPRARAEYRIVRMRCGAVRESGALYKYEEIAQDIEKMIADGTLKAYDRLPTVVELAEQYNVSKSTISQVIEALSTRGLITRRRGSGMYVKSIATEADSYWQNYNQVVNRRDEAGEPSEVEPDLEDLVVIRPEGHVARALDIGPKDFVYAVTRTLKAHGEALAVEYIYLPLDLASGFKYQDATGDIHAFITERMGFKIESMHNSVRAVMPTTEERAQLKIAYGTPLLEMERVGFLTDGRPFELVLSHYRSDLYEYRTIDSL